MSDWVCVTGGGGFIGSHMVEECLENGYRVRVIDDLATGTPRNLPRDSGRVAVHLIDVRCESELRPLLEGVKYVFHQAALPSVPRSLEEPIRTTDVNFMGTLTLFEQARRAEVERVVCASSSSVYGNRTRLPKTEEMATAPRSPYAASKDACETFARVYAETMGLETVMLRYFNVFGPRQDPTSPYSAVIPNFIRAFLRSSRPVIFGDGEQTRDFTFVKDVARANLEVALSGSSGEVYNVGCNRQTSVNELFDVLADLTGSTCDPIYQEPRKGDVRHSRASTEKLFEDTDFRPVWGLREGLERTVSWFREHPDRLDGETDAPPGPKGGR